MGLPICHCVCTAWLSTGLSLRTACIGSLQVLGLYVIPYRSNAFAIRYMLGRLVCTRLRSTVITLLNTVHALNEVIYWTVFKSIGKFTRQTCLLLFSFSFCASSVAPGRKVSESPPECLADVVHWRLAASKHCAICIGRKLILTRPHYQCYLSGTH